MNESTQHYQERRQDQNSQAVVLLMKELQESMNSVQREIKDLDRSVTYYRATQDEAIEKAIDKALHKAFPDGDPEGHRRHHEAVIKAAEDRAAMWKDARSSVIKWGAAGLALWLLKLVWAAALLGPPK